jgi:hypothetical protein
MVDLKTGEKHIKKLPKKAAVAGSKVYVSSKIVDALSYMKLHTESLEKQRNIHKERLKSLPSKRVIEDIRSAHHMEQSYAKEAAEDGDVV